MSKKKNTKQGQIDKGKSKSKEKIAAAEKVIENVAPVEEEIVLEVFSSAELLRTKETPAVEVPEVAELQADVARESDSVAELDDPIFAELATPKLPDLAKENRAQLLMQSPTRIQFYWSMKHNPFKVLGRAFGDPGSYSLVAKLVNEENGRENVVRVEAEGSYWFTVDADSTYHAEVGFYAPNRPFVRIMFSNTLITPRSKPSPRRATDADWAVTADEFADVLESTGYSQDAVEVALAGDDHERSDEATGRAFSQFIGEPAVDYVAIPAEEIRFALLALASGFSLEDLRGQIGKELFDVLKDNVEKLSSELALSSLADHFDVAFDEIGSEEFEGAAVYGSSAVHFPRSSIRKRISPKILVPKGFKPDLARRVAPVSSPESLIKHMSE